MSTLVGTSITFVLCMLLFLVLFVGGTDVVLYVFYKAGLSNILVYVVLAAVSFPVLGQAISGTLSNSLAWAVHSLGVWFLCIVPMLMPDVRFAYAVGFGVALFAACLMSHLVTEQYAAYLAANERMPLPTTEAYKGYWEGLPVFFRAAGPPELRAYTWSYVALAMMFAVGFKVMVRVGQAGYPAAAEFLGVLTVIALIPVAWLLLGGPWSAVQVTARSWHALVTFLCYDFVGTTAAGVFRFPRRWLRPAWLRHRALGAVFLVTLTAVLSVARPPDPFVQRAAPAFAAQTTLSADQTLFMQQLPQAEQQEYARAVLTGASKKAQAAHDRWVLYEDLRKFEHDTAGRVVPVAAVVLSAVLPVGLFFLVFTFTSGRLLCAYYQALEAPDATELPRNPATSSSGPARHTRQRLGPPHRADPRVAEPRRTRALLPGTEPLRRLPRTPAPEAPGTSRARPRELRVEQDLHRPGPAAQPGARARGQLGRHHRLEGRHVVLRVRPPGGALGGAAVPVVHEPHGPRELRLQPARPEPPAAAHRQSADPGRASRPCPWNTARTTAGATTRP